VQHREDHIHPGQRRRAVGRLQDHQLAPGGVGGKGHRGAGALGDLRQLAARDGKPLRIAARQDPPALTRDAHRDHVELRRVERAEDAARADRGDGVLGAAPAEDERHPDLAVGSECHEPDPTERRSATAPNTR
jgi:hypothetical protein